MGTTPSGCWHMDNVDETMKLFLIFFFKSRSTNNSRNRSIFKPDSVSIPHPTDPAMSKIPSPIPHLTCRTGSGHPPPGYKGGVINVGPRVLRQTIKRYAGPQYAPLLTRISFEVRSPQLEGQILTKTIKKSQIHVETFQGCHFLRKKSPCGMLHNESKSFYHLFRGPQYAGLLHIPFIFKKVRSTQPKP